ncbi:MAG: GNAT family N-acetyltransferase [Planctomycetota bacterium]
MPKVVLSRSPIAMVPRHQPWIPAWPEAKPRRAAASWHDADPTMAPIETERLRLRPVEPADALFLVRLLNEPSFLRFVGDRGVRTEAEARRAVVDMAPNPAARDGLGVYLVSQRYELGEPVGIVSLLKRDYLAHVDLGFALLGACQGRGYGFEAGKALLDHAVETLGHTHLLAITSPDNEVSGRLLAKLGFHPDGTVRVPPSNEKCRRYAFVATR